MVKVLHTDGVQASKILDTKFGASQAALRAYVVLYPCSS